MVDHLDSWASVKYLFSCASTLEDQSDISVVLARQGCDDYECSYDEAIEFAETHSDMQEYKDLKGELRRGLYSYAEGYFSPNGPFSRMAADRAVLYNDAGPFCEKMARYIIQKMPIVTPFKTDEMWVYDHGVYRRGADVLVAKAVQNLLTNITTNHIVQEVVGHVRRISRKTLTIDLLMDVGSEVCFKNGILDLRTHTFRHHDPSTFFVTQIPHAYDPKATCPETDNFYSEIVEPSDLRTLYEIVGYLFQPGYRYQKAVVLYGSGDNGKSTFIYQMRELLGGENVSNVPLHAFEKDVFAGADLFGKMANLCADMSTTDVYATGLFKQLTGGDWVRAQYKNVGSFNFLNRAKLIFSTNQLPVSTDDTDAFWKRWILLTFPNSYPVGSPKRDDSKLAKITTEEECSGLINKALTAFDEVISRGHFTGHTTPDQIRCRWLELSDTLYTFVTQMCVVDVGEVLDEEGMTTNRPGPKTLKPIFWARYSAFCRSLHMSPVPQRRLKEKLYEVTGGAVTDGQVSRSDGRKVWRNIALKDEKGSLKEVSISDF